MLNESRENPGAETGNIKYDPWAAIVDTGYKYRGTVEVKWPEEPASPRRARRRKRKQKVCIFRKMLGMLINNINNGGVINMKKVTMCKSCTVKMAQGSMKKKMTVSGDEKKKGKRQIDVVLGRLKNGYACKRETLAKLVFGPDFNENDLLKINRIISHIRAGGHEVEYIKEKKAYQLKS